MKKLSISFKQCKIFRGTRSHAQSPPVVVIESFIPSPLRVQTSNLSPAA